MSLVAAKKLGNKTQNCPEVDCQAVCGECEHIQYVYDNSEAISGSPEVFLGLVDSMLATHDNYMQQLCDYAPDICKRGELANFPCIQCGLIDPSCIVVGEPVYHLQACIDCVCFTPLDFSGCEQTHVDLSLAPYTDIYILIIDSLEELSSGYANGCTAEEFLKKFLPDAKLLFFKDSGYHFTIGNVSQDILAILPLLAALAPIPLGARLTYYLSCGETI